MDERGPPRPQRPRYRNELEEIESDGRFGYFEKSPPERCEHHSDDDKDYGERDGDVHSEGIGGALVALVVQSEVLAEGREGEGGGGYTLVRKGVLHYCMDTHSSENSTAFSIVILDSTSVHDIHVFV